MGVQGKDGQRPIQEFELGGSTTDLTLYFEHILMPNMRSILCCISDTRVYTSNRCPYILRTNRMTNNVTTNSPFPTCKFLMVE